MRLLEQKARQFHEDRSVEMAEVTQYLNELERRIDMTMFVIDLSKTVGHYNKYLIAGELTRATDHARSMSLKGKTALPIQYRRVTGKWETLLAVSEQIFLGKDS